MEEEAKPNLEQQLEVETQLAQSAEHAQEQKLLSQVAIPEAAAIVEIQPTLANPTIEKTADVLMCHVCGAESGADGKPWKSNQALQMHVRAKHGGLGQGRPKKGEPQPKPRFSTEPPDFSDIPQDNGLGAPQTPPDPSGPRLATPNYSGMAQITFDMSTGILTRLFGPEWQPVPPAKEGEPGERDVMITAIKNYYESIQMPDIPPGYMLAILCATYAAPRLAQPATKNKLQRGWLWLRSKFSKKRNGFKPAIVIKAETPGDI